MNQYCFTFFVKNEVQCTTVLQCRAINRFTLTSQTSPNLEFKLRKNGEKKLKNKI